MTETLKWSLPHAPCSSYARPLAGETITIIVELHNCGDISAENIDVQLLVDGVEKKVSTLRSLKSGGMDVKTMIFSWIAESGRHEIEVVIDPENNVIESHDQFTNGGEADNNRIRVNINVEGNSIVKELVNEHPMISTILIMLMSIIALLGISLLMKGKRK